MSSEEFTGWQNYYAVQPFGSKRDNYHAAIVATRIGNSHLVKGQQPFKLSDFMLSEEVEEEPQNVGALMAFMLQISGK